MIALPFWLVQERAHTAVHLAVKRGDRPAIPTYTERGYLPQPHNPNIARALTAAIILLLLLWVIVIWRIAS